MNQSSKMTMCSARYWKPPSLLLGGITTSTTYRHTHRECTRHVGIIAYLPGLRPNRRSYPCLHWNVRLRE